MNVVDLEQRNETPTYKSYNMTDDSVLFVANAEDENGDPLTATQRTRVFTSMFGSAIIAGKHKVYKGEYEKFSVNTLPFVAGEPDTGMLILVGM